MNVEESDLYLHPDPATLAVLPWRPQTGRVVRFYCDITYPDGSPFAGGSRAQLKAAVKDAAGMGFTVKIGTECEFYLFEMNELGRPTKIPQDFAGYMDVAPIDKEKMSVGRSASLWRKWDFSPKPHTTRPDLDKTK